MSERVDIFDRIMLLPVLRRLNGLYKKHKSVLLYIFFGGLTTVISIASFVVCDSFFGINELVSNVISWICAVTFAYLTNRVWVFNSKAKGKEILSEALYFCGGRVSTLLIEELLLLVFVTLLHFNSTVVKVIAQFVVLVLNYFISKLFVFREKK